MAIQDQDEQIPFFTPATAPSKDVVTDKDADDYTTLQRVMKLLDDGIYGLHKDFNAFDIVALIKNSSELDEAAKKLLTQILGKQEAYDILVPIRDMVFSAIESVDNQRKGL